MDMLHEALGDRPVATFSDVREHSPLPQVRAAAEVLAESGADGVIAVGGGSAVVTARAATILAAERKDIRELATHRDAEGRMISPRLLAPKLPNVVLATTPTTAYAKAGAAVRDPEAAERLALFDPKARAQLVVFDPMLARTAPASLVSSASLNMFAMAIDGMQTTADNPLAEALLSQGLREVLASLPALDADGGDDRERVRLMLAALLVGQGSDFAGTGIAQALSHAVGPISTTANGVVEAMLLPHTARFNRDVTGRSQARIAEDFPAGTPDARDLPDAIGRFLASSGVPTRLRDVGITQDQLPDAVAHTLGDWSITRVPKPAGEAELLDILQAAW